MSRLDWDKAKRKPSGEVRVPSDAQLELLAKLGVTRPPATSREASAIIDAHLKRKRRKK